MGSETCTACGKKDQKKKACKAKEKPSGEILSLYVCEDCNKQSISAASVCSPKEMAASYVCKKCGSPSVKKKNLCKPKPLEH